jgi:hypothetical protein
MFRGSLVLLAGLTTTLHAMPRSAVPALVGMTEVQKLKAPVGFIDDAIAFDGQRVAYVVADAAAKSELHVVTPGQPEIVIDLAAITLHATGLRLVGKRAFVIGKADHDNEVGAMIELVATSKSKPAGTVAFEVGPATHVAVIERDGKARIALHRVTATKTGTRHDVELDSLETGRRVAAGHAVELDTAARSKQLDLKVNHWSDGMTRASGLKGGEWNKKENQRSPDVEATYDLVSGRFVDRRPIADLFEQRKRFQVLADARGELDFVRMAWDNQSIQVWRAGKPKPLELDQPLSQYDPKSLQGVLQRDGTTWVALKVDPVNPDAVARKKADPEYLDIFRAGPDNKAVRKARVLATGVRHRFGVLDNGVWLLERSSGFDRGGRSLAIYKLD